LTITKKVAILVEIMGGSVFKQKYGVEGIRLSREDYFELQDFIFNQSFLNYGRPCDRAIWDIRTVQNKESFGDMDLLSMKDADCVIFDGQFKDMKKNGDVISFLLNDCWGAKFENFQVDIVKCEDFADMRARFFFYQFGVFGNILGRIVNSIDKNLHFGHEGFKYTYNGLSESRFYGDINLERCDDSESQARFLEFMGLPTVIPNFNDFVEVYEFLAQSRFFRKSAFSFDSMNHENRTRNRKRPDYNAFLVWLETANIEEREVCVAKMPINELSIFLNRSFPQSDFIKKLAGFKEQESIDYIIKSKFNGEIVSGITGLVNKDLGEFFVKFKSENPFWRSDILNKNEKEIGDMIRMTLVRPS
jgi:hypothetical protein